ncbi:MAG: NAD-dependent epimerase/dehydratase family protein [Candidatus Thorarchaeota archaeon]|jgi:UDP-glucose 4-epimerase
MIMTKTVLVTGAAGFIGSHLVDRLLDQGYTVIGIDSMRTGSIQNIEGAIESSSFILLEENICDQDLVNKIADDIHTVYHLAAISSVKFSLQDPFEVNDVNVGGTLNILDIARKRNAKRFVYSSSAAVYGNPTELPVTEDTPVYPLSPYAASKLSAEMYCLAYGESFGIRPTILRFFNVYGPRQEFSEYSGVIPIFINQALNGSSITIEGDGLQTRSFIHVDDVIKATILAGQSLLTGFHILNLSGTEAISILELAHMIKNYAPDSESEIIHGPVRLGDVKESIGSIDRISEILGFTPNVSFETGLERTVSWYEFNRSR